jgi:hypothetical protein
MGGADQACVYCRSNRYRMTRPGEQGPALGDHPIHRAIEVNDGKGRDGRSHGDQSSHRASGRDLCRRQSPPCRGLRTGVRSDLLVEKRHADDGSSERFQHLQRRDNLLTQRLTMPWA